jgi:type IV pilus assembly protein PilA
MRKQQGFTLIELMIVVAIIGILAAIAIPAYQDYTVRSKVTEAVNAMTAAKASVSEYYIALGIMPAGVQDAGISQTISSKYVNSITYARVTSTTARIEAIINTTNVGGSTGNNNNRVQLFGSGTAQRVDWDCARGNSNAIQDKYLPANCRDAAGGTMN